MNHDRPQPMPVADAMCQPGRTVWYPRLLDNGRVDTESLGREDRSEDFRHTVLARCKRLSFGQAPPQKEILERTFPVADQATTTSSMIAEKLRDIVGPQRLPYDTMWIEG